MDFRRPASAGAVTFQTNRGEFSSEEGGATGRLIACARADPPGEASCGSYSFTGTLNRASGMVSILYTHHIFGSLGERSKLRRYYEVRTAL
jgi:hypothetical protein